MRSARKFLLLRVGRSIDVNVRFLFPGLGGWIYHGGVSLLFLFRWIYDCGVTLLLLFRWIHHGSVTFFLLSRRVRDRGFLLFTSREQRHANEQANTFFHTDKSYLRRHFAVPVRSCFVETHALQHAGSIHLREVKSMLRWAVIFLGVALTAAVFGSTDIAAGTAGIAKLLVFLSSVMCGILFILGMAAQGRIP